MKSCKILSFAILSIILTLPAFGDEAAVVEKKATKEKTTNPSGTWRWESDRDGNTVKHELKLDANKKHEVTGTYFGMIDGLKSKKGMIKGNKLVLEFDIDRDGNTFQAKYEATIKDDKATGTLYLEGDQGSFDMPWEAKRSVELSDVVGSWELEMETPDGDLVEPILTVKKKGKDYVATWDGHEIGEFPAKDLKAKDGKFTFTLTGEIDGNEFVGKCVTKPMGSKLKGEMALEIGGNDIPLEFVGKIKKKKEKKS